MVTHGHAAPVTSSELIGDAASRARRHRRGGRGEWNRGPRPRTRPGSNCSATSAGTPAGNGRRSGWTTCSTSTRSCPTSARPWRSPGKDNPWSALYALADRVPVAVVTLGAAGRHGRGLRNRGGGVGAVPAGHGLDPTGAGDCFDAAFIVGSLAGWPLGNRLRFANLCASLAVQEVGGSLAAPGWGDIADWWKRANARPERQRASGCAASGSWPRSSRTSRSQPSAGPLPPSPTSRTPSSRLPEYRRPQRHADYPPAGRTRITKVTYPAATGEFSAAPGHGSRCTSGPP